VPLFDPKSGKRQIYGGGAETYLQSHRSLFMISNIYKRCVLYQVVNFMFFYFNPKSVHIQATLFQRP